MRRDNRNRNALAGGNGGKGRIGRRECAVMAVLAAVALFAVCSKRNNINNISYNKTKSLYRSTMTEEGVIEGSKGKIAFTFDDGPHPQYTEQLLDGLKERGVVATFFVTGEHAELHPDIIRRMQEDA